MSADRSCGYLHSHFFGGWNFIDDYRSSTSLGFHLYMVFFFLFQILLSRESKRSSMVEELTKLICNEYIYYMCKYSSEM